MVSDSLWPHGLCPPGSSVYGILQARILEWVAISYSRDWSQGQSPCCGFQGLTWSPAAPHPLLFWPITPLSAQAPALFASLLILRFICTPSCHGPWVYCPCAQALAPQTLSDDLIFKYLLKIHLTGGLDGKESACNAQDLGSIPGLERSAGGGHGSPLQYSCLILFDFKSQPFFFFFFE